MKFDLHVHTCHSRDGTATPKDVVRRCKQLGLDGFSVTDHNSLRGSLEAYELAKAEGLIAVRGVEVSTSDGHVLAYGVDEPLPRGLTAPETISVIRESGGIAVAAHPKRFPTGVGLGLAESGDFDAIEVLNGGNSSRANNAARMLAAKMGKPQTGGSDAHKIGEVGRAYTVLEGAFSEDQLVQAISRGESEARGVSRTMVNGVIYSMETLGEWLKGGFRRL